MAARSTGGVSAVLVSGFGQWKRLLSNTRVGWRTDWPLLSDVRRNWPFVQARRPTFAAARDMLGSS